MTTSALFVEHFSQTQFAKKWLTVRTNKNITEIRLHKEIRGITTHSEEVLLSLSFELFFSHWSSFYFRFGDFLFIDFSGASISSSSGFYRKFLWLVWTKTFQSLLLKKENCRATRRPLPRVLLPKKLNETISLVSQVSPGLCAVGPPSLHRGPSSQHLL